MAKGVEILVPPRTPTDRNATLYFVHMRMVYVNATVDHGDSDSLSFGALEHAHVDRIGPCALQIHLMGTGVLHRLSEHSAPFPRQHVSCKQPPVLQRRLGDSAVAALDQCAPLGASVIICVTTSLLTSI